MLLLSLLVNDVDVWKALQEVGSTKEAWVYLVFGLIGIFTSAFVTTYTEKRFPKWFDLYQLAGWTPFVLGVALLADMSPWLSLAIGIAPERIYKAVQKSDLNISIGTDGIRFGKKTLPPVEPPPNTLEEKNK